MDPRAAARPLLGARGFSLVELMVCTVILVIAALAAAPALIGAQESWQNANDSIQSNLVRDSRQARIAFSRAARQAHRQTLTVAANARSMDLPYYESPDSTWPDRYVTLSWSNATGCLNWSEGRIDRNGRRQTLGDAVVCENVTACAFARRGKSARMRLVFTNGTRELTLVTAAVINN